MSARPDTISEHDWLSDLALERIEALVPRVPQDFTVDVNAYAKTVQVTLRWEKPAAVIERANCIDPLINAAMCVDTLVKNLRGERAWRDRAENGEHA